MWCRLICGSICTTAPLFPLFGPGRSMETMLPRCLTFGKLDGDGCGSRCNPLNLNVDRCWQGISGPAPRHPLPVCQLCLTCKNSKCKHSDHSALSEHWEPKQVGKWAWPDLTSFQGFSPTWSQGLDRSVEHFLPRANSLQRSVCDLGWYYVHWHGGEGGLTRYNLPDVMPEMHTVTSVTNLTLKKLKEIFSVFLVPPQTSVIPCFSFATLNDLHVRPVIRNAPSTSRNVLSDTRVRNGNAWTVCHALSELGMKHRSSLENLQDSYSWGCEVQLRHCKLNL